MKLATAVLLACPAVSLAQQVAIGEFYMPAPITAPSYITPGPDGAVWFVDGPQIGRATPAGQITQFPTPPPWDVSSITAGPDGNIWFVPANYEAAMIGRMTTAGEITEFPLPNPGSEPLFITAGPDGALWFTDYGTNQIGRITTSGAVSEYPVPTTRAGVGGITKGPDGALWFMESFGNNIGRITTSGVITEYAVPTPNADLSCCLTPGPDGAVWFTETQVDKIGRITHDGAITEFQISANSRPAGITAGPDGALWFTVYEGRIGRITTSGEISYYPVPRPDELGFIAKGPDGELWFTATTGYSGDYMPGLIGEVVFESANLSVTPSTGYYRTELQFTGSGYAPNETVQIYVSGVGSPVLASATADASGAISVLAHAPQSPYFYNNPRLFLGVGQSSGKTGTANFTVKPRLLLTPNAGATGSPATVSGFGYGPFEKVRVGWDNPRTVLGTVTTDVNGTFYKSTAIEFTVPPGAAPGANKVIGYGWNTGITGFASFTVE